MRVTTMLFATLLCLVSCRSTRGPGSYVPSRAEAETTFAGLSSKRVLEAALFYPKSLEAVQEQPMALTASDGTGLKLVSLDAKAVVQGPLAFTELHLTFLNPEARQIEGRFTITLPPGAAISRFAMNLPGGWQEAEVVERQQAQQIYEDFLHRKQDPALLEKKAGNQFNARIFPIPASGTKEIKISYSQQLAAREQPYRLYLKGLPKIDKLEITAMVGEQVADKQASSLGGETISHKIVRVSKSDFAPDRDFEVRTQSTLEGLRHGNLAMMRVEPALPTTRAPLESLMLLVDTSASRAAGFYPQVEQIGALLRELKQVYGGGAALHVACYDQVVSSVYRGSLGDFSRRDLDAILARRPLGASDLGRALAWAGGVSGARRLLIVTDGISTSGHSEPDALHAAVKRLASKVDRLDVMLMGGIREEAAMRGLVSGALEQDGLLLDGDQPAQRLAQRLSRRTVSGIRVSVPGARWVWPSRIDGAQAGDQVLVFADLPAALPGGQMNVALEGPISAHHGATLATTKRPLLERAWVEARIAHLQRQQAVGAVDPDMKGAILKQILELSTKHRVLSDYTAMLVLETEQDYQRYNLKRTALADILVVGASGVEVQQRTTPVIPAIVDQPPPAWRRPPRPDEQIRLRDSEAGRAEPRDHTAGAPPSAAPVLVPKPSPAPSPEPAAKSSARGVEFDGRLVRGQSSPPPTADREAPSRRAPSARPSEVEFDARLSQGDGAQDSDDTPKGPAALSGKLADVMKLITDGKIEDALVTSLRWRAEQPGDVMALIALGEALQANGNNGLAARVYGSIIDLFPSRADMLRFAGERLEALGKVGLELAADAYAQAVKQRPDHALGHRLLAMAQARRGQHDAALSALEAGLSQSYRIERAGVQRILREDLGLVAAAIVARSSGRREELTQRLARFGAKIDDQPSLRFVLTWETDANDVDFHIRDGRGGHASYRSKQLPSGGELYADVTNGYGPECFTIPRTPEAFPYKLQIHYYSRGPMGYGMGKIQILQHDGKGGLAFEDRPFVVMNDQAYVDLGVVKGSL
jgi:tetratricopeptide (TPR) repeat protein